MSSARHVPAAWLLQQLEDPHARMGDLQAGLAQILRFHGLRSRGVNADGRCLQRSRAASAANLQCIIGLLPDLPRSPHAQAPARRPVPGRRCLRLRRRSTGSRSTRATCSRRQAVDQLKPGMSKQQVMALLGTPSVADPFHHDRWDYVATRAHRPHGNTEVKNLTLWFEGDALAQVGRRVLPGAGRRRCAQEMREFGNLPKDKDKKKREPRLQRARLRRAFQRGAASAPGAAARPSDPPPAAAAVRRRSPSRSGASAPTRSPNTGKRRRRRRPALASPPRCSASATVAPLGSDRRVAATRSAAASAQHHFDAHHASVRTAVGVARTKSSTMRSASALEAERQRRPEQLARRLEVERQA